MPNSMVVKDNGEDQYPVGTPSTAKQWTEVFGGDGGDTVVDYTNNAVVYEEYVHLAISKSTDGGATWFPATTGINPADPSNFIAPYIMSPSNHNELFAGTDHSISLLMVPLLGQPQVLRQAPGVPLNVIAVAQVTTAMCMLEIIV